MGYGHAERNLALIRQLQAETRALLCTLEQPDPEHSAWLQGVASSERQAVHQRRRDKHLSHSADRARSLLRCGVLIPIAAGNITRATIALTTAGLPSGLAGERQTAASPAMKGYKKMGKAKDIHEAVGAELDFDPLVNAAGITVKNMNGQVALNGIVSSYPQYLEAAAAAQRVAGVTDVHNHLEVVLPDGDYRDDAMLTTAANNALTLNVPCRPVLRRPPGTAT